jgi:hypothetical protein
MASALLGTLKAQPEFAKLLSASGLAQATPEVQLAAVVATAVAVLAVLVSLLKALFGRKDLPPTVACLPLVGGFIRFLKARLGFAHSGRPVRAPPQRRGLCPRGSETRSGARRQHRGRRYSGSRKAGARTRRVLTSRCATGTAAADGRLVQEARRGVHCAAVPPPGHLPDRPGGVAALLQGTSRRSRRLAGSRDAGRGAQAPAVRIGAAGPPSRVAARRSG